MNPTTMMGIGGIMGGIGSLASGFGSVFGGGGDSPPSPMQIANHFSRKAFDAQKKFLGPQYQLMAPEYALGGPADMWQQAMLSGYFPTIDFASQIAALENTIAGINLKSKKPSTRIANEAKHGTYTAMLERLKAQQAAYGDMGGQSIYDVVSNHPLTQGLEGLGLNELRRANAALGIPASSADALSKARLSQNNWLTGLGQLQNQANYLSGRGTAGMQGVLGITNNALANGLGAFGAGPTSTAMSVQPQQQPSPWGPISNMFTSLGQQISDYPMNAAITQRILQMSGSGGGGSNNPTLAATLMNQPSGAYGNLLSSDRLGYF